MRRLPPQPGEVIDRRRRLSFQLDGEPYEAYPGDTIGSALAAAGLRIFSRSFKYHRPRGLLCCSGHCPNCLMNVNGVPNVRVCRQPVRQGDRVTSQHNWPSLERDFLSVIEKFDRFLPVGFYYKTLFKPRLAWKLAEPVIRRLAGLGRLDGAGPAQPYTHEHRHTEVVVVGGGPAGMAAALAAADAGCEVLLSDRELHPGGHLSYQRRALADPESGETRAGYQIGRNLSRKLEAHPGITVLRGALVFGGYEGTLMGVIRGRHLIHVRASQVVLAAGNYEYPSLFENNDLPGVLLGGAALRLIHLYGVQPGERAVVVAAEEEGLALALDLQQVGVEVAALIDPRSSLPPEGAERLEAAGIPHLFGHRPLKAHGRRQVRGLTVQPREGGAGRTLDCDLICLADQKAPALDLLRQAGGRVRYHPVLARMVPQEIPPGFHCAGHLTGAPDLSTVLLQGWIAGLQAAANLRPLSDSLARELSRLKTQLGEGGTPAPGASDPESLPAPARGKEFVCLCEDVTRLDIGHAVAEGFTEMELLKRYTTASMGPCQGRMCLMPLARCCASATGAGLAQTGTTTSRPPVEPIPLGALAGPHHHPVKLTPMHHQHLRAGARQMDMGEWKRPFSYTRPALEWRAVRERVGLIDVSTLGKLEVQGRDAGALLDKIYTHVFSTLKVGRIRYGVICGEDGIILDDGTVTRLGEDHYYITTTSGNTEFVEGWINWWCSLGGICAHVTNVTGDFAAVNLAGPRAREVLEKLTPVDLSPEVFKYMQCGQGEVAGVPSRLLRIGFVGETGWEIHVPACYGAYLWEALMQAGREFGISPVGVEAQRILRLEKKHLIVGQDTDALSNPLEADMTWVVKFQKADFVGKSILESVRRRGPELQLVGFTADELVEEGCAVVVDGKPLGRVTSARLSPEQNRCVGLAWIPHVLSADKRWFQIHQEGRLVRARVHHAPFYDAAGKRLRQ